MKIVLAFDLLSDRGVSYPLHAATDQDRTVGRDPAAIEERGGFWLARLQPTAGIWLEDGKPLEKRLKRRRISPVESGIHALT